jgi:hypothetical protein
MSGNIPQDPFNSDGVDFTQFGANFRSLYMSLVASGFKEPEALEISIRVNCAILAKMTA